jgi:phosphoribosylformylglycinamidine cyclo-ligase
LSDGQVTDAYGRSGVDQDLADLAVSRLVAALAAGSGGGPSRKVDLDGHYAAVLALDGQLGIALATDGVGTKILVAEEMGRYDTIGIDCVAMNVNDVICVGAEPIAMLDYLAVEKADPDVCEQLGVGLARGAELAGIEIPGGELAQIGELVKGFDIAGSCFGTVALDRIVDGSGVEPGDLVIGLPSSGIHSNGYTLARSALEGLPMEDESLGRPLGDLLLEPTAIYVRAVMELLGSEVPVHGLAHITSGGLDNLLRLRAEVRYEIDEPLEAQPLFGLIAERGDVPEEEMYRVFNMGCGFCCVVPADAGGDAISILERHHPGTRRIGEVVEGPKSVLRSD